MRMIDIRTPLEVQILTIYTNHCVYYKAPKIATSISKSMAMEFMDEIKESILFWLDDWLLNIKNFRDHKFLPI